MTTVNEQGAEYGDRDTVYYPESDGMPMGETDLHRNWMFRIYEMMRYRYRQQKVYIASDLLLYYIQGQPAKFVVPDVFVVLDCPAGDRRVFKTWEESQVPTAVFEVTSKSTSRNDEVDKPVIYEQMGVREYYLYDPEGEYLSPRLKGFRMIDGAMHEIANDNGRIDCQSLGLMLGLDSEGGLVIWDSKSGSELLTGEEAERRAKESERKAKEAERKAKEAEREARLKAEKELEELRRQIRDLDDR